MKKIVSDILKAIEILGGVAAQGASAILSPAGLCFNALEFVLSVPVMISEFKMT